MSRNGTGAHGVTNHVGEVFLDNSTSETHSGLIVVDGAVIPGALGVNPGATISALAERAVEHYARLNGLHISRESNGVLDLYGNPAHCPRPQTPDITTTIQGSARTLSLTRTTDERRLMRRLDPVRHGGPNTVSFTEHMSGYLHARNNLRLQEKGAHTNAFQAGRSRGEAARLLTSNVMYVAERVDYKSPKRLYKGVVTGILTCPSINGSPFMISRGEVELLRPDEEVSGTTKVTYRFDMTGINGRRLGLHGYKVIDSSVSMSFKRMWRSTTTLNVTITELDDTRPSTQSACASPSTSPRYETLAKQNQENTAAKYESSGRTIAAGVLRIRFSDFRKQLLTLTPMGKSLLAKAATLTQFTLYFSSKLVPHFLLPMAPLQYTTKQHAEFINPTPPTQTVIVTASDGVRTKLHMWEPQLENIAEDASGNPVSVQNLFMIPGAAVDHQIYALPTIPVNAVNYFTRAGYRVFVTVHRIGIVDHPEDKSWTTYNARLDIKACLEHIRATQNTKKVYTIAHCMGSVAFACGLLDGTIPADWILGITCSQVFMNPVWSKSNIFKTSIGLDKVYARLAGHWFNCRASTKEGVLQSAMNQLLRFLPDKKGEKCSNACCHRITLLFGRCWSHFNLNEATHRHMDQFFNGANMTLMPLLMRMGRFGAVSTNGPAYQDLTGAHNVERLRGIPFFFFSGGDSDVLSPVATQKTYEKLCDTFGLSAGRACGGIQYRRKVIPGYGHLDGWMGRNAWRDVYPMVREEVDRVVRGEAYRCQERANPFSDAMALQ